MGSLKMSIFRYRSFNSICTILELRLLTGSLCTLVNIFGKHLKVSSWLKVKLMDYNNRLYLEDISRIIFKFYILNTLYLFSPKYLSIYSFFSITLYLHMYYICMYIKSDLCCVFIFLDRWNKRHFLRIQKRKDKL